MKIIYTPPKSFFRDGVQLTCAGGYDGWSIDNFDSPPLRLPVLRSNGSLFVTISIPNFARSLDLFFTDGIKYDLNGGELYRIPIYKIQATFTSRSSFHGQWLSNSLYVEISIILLGTPIEQVHTGEARKLILQLPCSSSMTASSTGTRIGNTYASIPARARARTHARNP